jgi:RES domain
MIEEKLGIGIFHYGPPLWRLGEIGPLDALKNEGTQQAAAIDVIRRFPRRSLAVGEIFYRLRKGVESERASEPAQYDTPPGGSSGTGRLGAPKFPVLYGSQDLEICVHECRVTKIDECYLATLKVAQPLDVLDLCSEISNDGGTPFDSLFLAIQFIFSAENHGYNISRAIATAAKDAGLHGIAYPSYFSSFRKDRIPNIGLFGYPIAEGSIELLCINRLILDTAQYGVRLGPCLPE